MGEVPLLLAFGIFGGIIGEVFLSHKFSCEVFLLIACTEDEEDLEDDQLLCSQQSDENYFADTEDYSSVSSESDSALSDSENWDESICGELFVFNPLI